MHHSKASWLAWTLCMLVAGLDAVGLALGVYTSNVPYFVPALVQTALQYISPLVFGVVGALIVAHQPRNTIGWLLMAIALGWTAGSIIEGYLLRSVTTTLVPTLAILAGIWFNGWSWWVLIGPLMLILVLFPTGRPPSRRWRWLIAAVAALFSIFLFIATFAEVFESPTTGIRFRNPLGFIPASLMDLFFGWPWFTMLVTTVTFCVAAVFVRYRRATPQERAQIKWFLYACAVFLSTYVPAAFVADNAAFFGGWFNVLFDLAILIIPASIGIAILRYRLYDIDVIIRRTLIYGTLTAILAVVYIGSVVALQRLMVPLIGRESQLAIVGSTLTIAALFQPLRRRIQNVIDRRFYRRKYDSQRVLESFAARLRNETDLETLTHYIVDVVQETLQPTHVSLWLHNFEKEKHGTKRV